MDRQTAVSVDSSGSAPAAVSAQLLDLKHLNHQTLGDVNLRRIVLGLFLDEAPQYAANLRTAANRKAWHMAVHTLKGVALNLGAFPLAWACKDCEAQDFAEGTLAHLGAAERLAGLMEDTAAVIRQTLNS